MTEILEPARQLVARKRHDCNICDGYCIEPGEKYRRMVVLYEGRREVVRYCLAEECKRMGIRNE